VVIFPYICLKNRPYIWIYMVGTSHLAEMAIDYISLYNKQHFIVEVTKMGSVGSSPAMIDRNIIKPVVGTKKMYQCNHSKPFLMVKE
jgi:hypothetical protein